ncbi:MAG: hypothetical protein ACI36X_06995 [Bacteroidaceae bacterium]
MKNEDTILKSPESTNEETLLQTEETQLDNTATRPASPAAEAAPNRPTWVKMAGSAGTGLLLGAASTLLVSATPSDPEEMAEVTGQHTSDHTPDPTPAATAIESVPVATGVTDEMSFSEAFAAARHEVGPGGAFEWHGNVYGTYYAEEWNAMSEAQQNDFYSHVTLTPDAQPGTTETAEVVGVQTQPVAQTEPSVQTEPVAQTEPVSAEVEVLGVTHDAETGANVVNLTVDGHNAILVDIDNDHQIDAMAIDLNNDGQVSDSEIVNVSDQGLTIEQFGGVGSPTGNMYASNEPLPDYVNNANMDNYNA